VFAADDEIAMVPSTAFAEDNEKEEVVEVCLGLQKLTEKLDLVVTSLEVVESVKEAEDEIVQRGVATMLTKQPSQLYQ
jgi:hypothetical protein